MTTKNRLGRDAGSPVENGPTYTAIDGKLIWELNEIQQELDPVEAIAELRAKNERLADKAQEQADNGDWSMMARQKARELLIEAIVAEFGLSEEGEQPDEQTA